MSVAFLNRSGGLASGTTASSVLHCRTARHRCRQECIGDVAVLITLYAADPALQSLQRVHTSMFTPVCCLRHSVIVLATATCWSSSLSSLTTGVWLPRHISQQQQPSPRQLTRHCATGPGTDSTAAVRLPPSMIPQSNLTVSQVRFSRKICCRRDADPSHLYCCLCSDVLL